MLTDSTGYFSNRSSIISIVYKEAYKTTIFNYGLFDQGYVQYSTKGRLFSYQTTPIEIYALTTYGVFGGKFFSTSLGVRLNFNSLSIYASKSLMTTSCGLQTKSGYASFSIGLVGETIWDVGIGCSFEVNNTYLNVKVPLTAVIVVCVIVIVGPVVALSAVAASIVFSLTDSGDLEEERYE